MPATSQEIEFAKAAAEMAATILPQLRREQEEIARRIAWHEGNVAVWETMRENHQTPPNSPPCLVVDQLLADSPRAKRGEAQDRVLRIMRANPGIKAKEISKELERENGLAYPLSTIYRIMDLVKEKSKTPA